MTLEFSKMAGAGNDFIMIDNLAGSLKSGFPELARRLSNRKLSIGSDGLIVMEKSAKADVGMRIFNPDGSEAEMCGNGVRCLAKFAVDKKIAKDKLTIDTLAGLIGAEVRGDVVTVKMADPKDLKLGLTIDLNGKRQDMHFINTGVPHAVVVTDKLEEVDVFTQGRAIRRHSQFAPRGANANFISIRFDNSISIRTYERGVEDETLACGTGSTAGALVAAALKSFTSPVKVHTHGGEVLEIFFSRDGMNFHDVYLKGPVSTSFEGRVTV